MRGRKKKSGVDSGRKEYESRPQPGTPRTRGERAVDGATTTDKDQKVGYLASRGSLDFRDGKPVTEEIKHGCEVRKSLNGRIGINQKHHRSMERNRNLG